MAFLLCIETATPMCTVALAHDGYVLAHAAEEGDPANAERRYIHAERTNVLIQAIMDRTGLAFKDLDGVAVGVGPGSYTGLRIGLSAAKGLCYALGIPIIGIGTLDTLVAALRQRIPDPVVTEDVLWPMIDARRMEVFTSVRNASGYGEGPTHPQVLDEAWCAALPAGKRHVVFGDGADKAAMLWATSEHVLHLPGVRPLASMMAGIAMARWSAGQLDDLAYLVPEYGKEARPTRPRPRS
ncbi:MAG: tRNA (adenosine(37)-N6)-threonylcarbamoyltransferase complex dimerization subunit type 1 TsaB [Flavobacteriales bacterium]|nr:tRNA (adenosine(37)-N6)-threonylcarbamoyltransferase complex dimerization subunit type 1 TsaB [Flavobacteriales bacterium]MCB9167349.1 tRNA (adenosine(37)-N6)-threonylcarbamoyltransferase complex dimerization subunit type 1 TsaB [Flavobacteriales bacterium]